MHSTPRRLSLFAASLFLVAAAHAHPGHDGHEFTWDFSHVAAHPFATMGSIAAIGVVAWIGWGAARLGAQSLRESHAKRGK